MKTFWAVTFGVVVLMAAGTAGAGTATMDFANGAGLMSYKFSAGSGTLVAQGGRAYFTGANTTLLARDGAPITNTGTVNMTMMLSPYNDAGNAMGFVIIDSHDSSNRITALCAANGQVTLMDAHGTTISSSFTYPSAYNNSLTLSFSPSTGRATMTLNSSQSVFRDDALAGATSAWVGVMCGGTGGFDNLILTGSNIPDYPPADFDGDGASDQEEAAAGTDPADPGNRPVSNTGATLTATNGVSVTFPAGCLTSSPINARISVPDGLPAGTAPAGLSLTPKGTQLGPNNATFAAPVTVTVPYAAADIAGLEEAGLTALYFNGVNYAANGIAGVSVNAAANTLTFTTTHFTIFALAGPLIDSDDDGTPDVEDDFPHNPYGQTDTDGDGVGDEWEDSWFGDLTTVGATSDSDNDGVTDREEFDMASFGVDPTDGKTQLPISGMAAALAGIVIAAAARKRLTRG